MCDSKIFREMCAHYAAGILKQGTGTFIIQKAKQDVWRRQIDSWFVPSSLLYVIHHCQPCMLAAARGAAFLALPSGGWELSRAEQGWEGPLAGEALGRQGSSGAAAALQEGETRCISLAVSWQ